jgi:hypothetical protein
LHRQKLTDDELLALLHSAGADEQEAWSVVDRAADD